MILRLEDENDFLEYREGSGNTIEIFDIQIGSKRRRGNGRKLIDLLVSLVQKKYSAHLIFAITRTENLIAKQFYEAVGFRVVGVLADFYGTRTEEGKDTCDAIMYGLNVSNTKDT